MRWFAGLTTVAAVVASCLSATAVAPAAATAVLTISGNTLIVRTPMDQMLQGALCRAPAFTCKPLDYASGAIVSTPLEEAAEELRRSLLNEPGPTIVLAHSQGTMIASTWLTSYGAQAGRAGDVLFVMLGSPQHGRGGVGLAVGSTEWPPTPTDTGYTVIEVARQYDMEADFPTRLLNWAAVVNAYSGYWGIHTDYADVDLRDPDNLVAQVGGTTYVLIPTEHLPMLQPLRWFGLNALADTLNHVWKPIVDAGYDRSGYVTLARAWQDNYALPEILAPRNETDETDDTAVAAPARIATPPPEVAQPDIDTERPESVEVIAPADADEVVADVGRDQDSRPDTGSGGDDRARPSESDGQSTRSREPKVDSAARGDHKKTAGAPSPRD